jgi:putative ABC transport system permease protein
MNMLAELARRLLMLLRRRQFDADLDAEMRLHRELREQEQIERGCLPKEAHYAAQRRFGNDLVLREESRDMWGWTWLENLVQDIRYGLRILAKNPGFTVVTALTLALGIGGTTSIFNIVNAVLLRPLPFSGASRLMMLGEGIPQMGFPKMGFSAPDLRVFERTQRSFEGLGAFESQEMDISGHGEPERLTVTRVSASLFSMLGITPIFGRSFTPDEDAPGLNVALLSYGLWQRRYGADHAVVGQKLQLDRRPYTVVGVMPQDFDFPPRGARANHAAEVWVPMAFTSAELQGWGMDYGVTVLGQLRAQIRLEQARAEAESLSYAIRRNYPPELLKAFHGAQLEVHVDPFHEELVGSVRTPLLVLMAAVAMVLLIGCANVATLLLSRAAARQREVAIRTALGATPARLLGQMLVESVLLALGGGAMGSLLAAWSTNLLLSLVPEGVALPHHISTGGRMTVLALVISCLVAVVFGLAPALQVSLVSPRDSLQYGGRSGTPSREQHRLQSFFVTSQFALGLLLLVGAGLLIRSFGKLVETDSGFRPDHVLTLNLPLPSQAYPKGADVRQFYEQLLERVGNLPGVTLAALSSDLPLRGIGTVAITMEGQNNAESQGPQAVCQTWVVGNYFQTMGIPVLKGRPFGPEDRTDSQPVAVVSQSMARQLWPGRDAIGKRIRWGVYAPWQTIVGIVGDVNDAPLGQPVQMHVYRPYLQLPDPFFENGSLGDVRALYLALRTQLDPASLSSATVGQIHTLDPDLAATDIRTMTQVTSSSAAGAKFNTFLLSIFAGVALFLAAIGIYAVLAYAVTQHKHEIGIRLALGAAPGDVLSLYLKSGMRLAGLGSAIGLVAALALARLMASMLYGVSAADPVTIATVAIVLLSVALLACYIPARRATKVDPMVALRFE